MYTLILMLICIYVSVSDYKTHLHIMSMEQYPLQIHQAYNRAIDIDTMVKKKNGTVFITVATYGYREFTVDFYRINHIQDYNNFFVVVQDLPSYQVRNLLFLLFSSFNLKRFL